MAQHTYLLPPSSYSYKPVRQSFPWSKFILSFLMISTFLVFATTGTSGAETVASWTGQLWDIMTGTALFSLAVALLIWARRMMPKNI